MEDSRQKPGFFVRLATLIVDKRNLFFLLYAAGIVFSLISQGWVQVNNDITDYLPEETETRQGLQLMDDEFTTFGTARVMISNITYEKAEDLKDVIEAIPGVSSVTFGDQVDEDENTIDADDRDDYYKDSAALYSVTFEGETDDPVSEAAMVQLRETLKDYDLSISSEVGEDGSARLEKEMQSILVVAAITILVVLFLTSRTYGEIPVLLLTFVAAALLNKGTNYLLGEISFISDSIAVVLQLALAIDYAIILLHRFPGAAGLLRNRDGLRPGPGGRQSRRSRLQSSRRWSCRSSRPCCPDRTSRRAETGGRWRGPRCCSRWRCGHGCRGRASS